MSVQKRGKTWVVRWKEGDRHRQRTFNRKGDAQLFDAELRRRRRLGSLAQLDAGGETLDAYTTGTWAATYAPLLAPRTRALYTWLYDHELAPTLGSVPLRDLSAEMIGRWQADRLAAGAGAEAVRKALALLGGILQRAVEAGRIEANHARLVRRAPAPRKLEVRPLAPETIEAMRAAMMAPLDVAVPASARRAAYVLRDTRDPLARHRDAVLLSILAYAGLRPGEALALRWGDVRENTLLIERAVSLGVECDTKTRAHRAVRLLAPLAADLREWRLRSGRPAERALVIPGRGGALWTEAAYASWRRNAFARAPAAAGVEHARAYDLRHSFASLLLHEGRSVIYVARQLGHDANLTLSTYGHVIDELDDQPRQDAEAAIMAARLSAVAPELRTDANRPRS